MSGIEYTIGLFVLAVKVFHHAVFASLWNFALADLHLQSEVEAYRKVHKHWEWLYNMSVEMNNQEFIDYCEEMLRNIETYF